MNVRPIPCSEIAASRLGLGCAGLMRVTSATERDRLLAAAFDLGIRHFDVARLYGLGAAEAEVGRFARTRRDDITVATKFGLDPARGLGRLGSLQQPVRALANRVPAIRRALKKRAGSTVTAGNYGPAHARASLDTSLQQLGLDHVDFLFVHGPGPEAALDYPGLRAFFDEAVQAGKIRRWGISYDEVAGFDPKAGLGDQAVLQVRETVFARRPRMEPYLSFGVLGKPLEVIGERLRGNPELRRQWSEALGVDAGSGPELAKLLLSDALAANDRGTVLYGTVRVDRLQHAAGVLDAPSPPDAIETLRALAAADRAAL